MPNPCALGAFALLCLALPAQAQRDGSCEASWLPTFGGQPGLSSAPLDFAVFDPGTGAGPGLYAGGAFSTANGIPASYVGRWDGTSWSPLGSGTDFVVLAVEVYDDGAGPALYAAGAFQFAGGVPASHVAKWDGTTWSPLGLGTDGTVSALAVYDDGLGGGPALYAAGTFSSAGGVPANNIAKWKGGWLAAGSGLDAGVYSLAVYDDGLGGGPALYAGGLFKQAGGLPARRVAKWDSSGWSALSSGVNAFVETLAVFDDGTGGGPALYVGGAFTSAGGGGANSVARWDGTFWSPLGSGMDSRVSSLAVHDDGGGAALYAGGSFTTAGGGPASSVARWDGTSWSPLGVGVNDQVESLFSYDDGSGPALFTGGAFTMAGGLAATYIAKWQSTGWEPIGSGLNDTVLSLAAHDDGGGEALFAGGLFTSAGGAPANFVAEWDGASWSPLGSGMNDLVRALASHDDGSGLALFAAGQFTVAGGVPVGYAAKWDGTSWSPLGGGLGKQASALVEFDDGAGGGPALFAGGSFTVAGGGPGNYVAKWDGASWAPLGSGMNSPVLALTVHDDGGGPALFAGGLFFTAGGLPANGIARWDGTSWSPLANGVGGFVFSLASSGQVGGSLYVGGQFNAASGVPVSNVAEWQGSSWYSLGLGSASSVLALAMYDEGLGAGPVLYAAGGPWGVGGSVNQMAKLEGALWTPLGSGFYGPVNTLATFDLGGSSLLAGGAFTSAPESGDSFLARWGGCHPSYETYCTAGTSASGCQALLSATGAASATAPSGFELIAATVEGAKDGIFYYGTNGRLAVPWGNGTSYRCVAPPVKRGGLLTGGGTQGACDGSFVQDLNARWCPTCPKPLHNPGAGAVVQAQLWYRDPFSTDNQTTSFSDAVEFLVQP